MSKKDTIIKGAFILTLTGFLSRFIGFFYRIFLSQTFGAEGVGLYQLIFPVFALGISLTTAGIEVALSRLVAQKSSLGKTCETREIVLAGLFISMLLSFTTMIILQQNAYWFAEHILHDIRCADLLIVLSYVFPFASIHGCINGYYLGLKQTKPMSVSQIIEQLVRVASVFIICMAMQRTTQSLSIITAVLGLVLGEIFSAFYCIVMFFKPQADSTFVSTPKQNYFLRAKELLVLSVPLTTNRVLLNVLQSIESVSIPGCLVLSGLNNREALSLYGVLTGMAMPCIFFPSAITSSVSTMLLPTIAEIQAQSERRTLLCLIRKAVGCIFFLGCGCAMMFLLFGTFIGNLLFQNETAGKLILTLAWICPFLYTNNTLISILNGLGKTSSSLFINICGLCVRIGSVFFLIPSLGIIGYLRGLLGSQIIISALSLICIRQYFTSD